MVTDYRGHRQTLLPVRDINLKASRHRLRFVNRHRLIVPRCRLNTYGRRAFPVV